MVQARQAEVFALQARVLELSKENNLLKRAVTIQQARLVEAQDTGRQQVAQAEGVISQLQASGIAICQVRWLWLESVILLTLCAPICRAKSMHWRWQITASACTSGKLLVVHSLISPIQMSSNADSLNGSQGSGNR